MLKAAIMVASLGLLAACATTGSPSASSSGSTPAPSAPPAAAAVQLSAAEEAAGKTLLNERCSTCHSVEQAIQLPRPASSWDRIVRSMIERGAVLTDAESVTLKNYLAARHSINFGG